MSHNKKVLLKSNNFLISVIIPHYNSNGLIRRTLNSIPNRSDIQIIVIDDFSTEPSIKHIAQEVCYKHVSFVFLDENLTAGGARNVGLSLAAGQYVVFSDSDDYFSEEAFDIFTNVIRSKKDLYQFRVSSFIENTFEMGSRHLYLGRFYEMKNHEGLLGIPGPVAKLIKLDFIQAHKIRFSKVPVGNDMVFSATVSCKVVEFEFIDNIVYFVSQNENSLTATKSLENTLYRIQENIIRNKVIRQSNIVSNLYYFSEHNFVLDYTKLILKYKNKSYNRLYIKYVLSVPFLSICCWGFKKILKRMVSKKK